MGFEHISVTCIMVASGFLSDVLLLFTQVDRCVTPFNHGKLTAEDARRQAEAGGTPEKAGEAKRVEGGAAKAEVQAKAEQAAERRGRRRMRDECRRRQVEEGVAEAGARARRRTERGRRRSGGGGTGKR